MTAGLEFSILSAIIDRRYSAKKLVVTQPLKPWMAIRHTLRQG